MANNIANILKGRFLVNDGAFTNWAFIVFCALLAIIMIASSHSAERKVYRVAELNQELRELRSEFVDTRKNLMQQKMESNVARKMKQRSIGLSDKPPYKIIVKSN
ncbi:FtsL-like putative cell division protein [Psychroflexus tropicus]|uniref:FtsL-like putative cell division protein n=1 Tax=Psychroflexus tropicus TaxID=197345 RepID=UPI00039D0DB1|nr:FtsL-like putative cell division protein [Psychroflexus tropicus]